MRRPALLRWRWPAFAAALLGIAAAFCYGWFGPQQAQLAELERQEAKCRLENAAGEAFAAQHPDLPAYAAAVQKRRAAAAEKLPDRASAGGFIPELETAARQSGLRLLKIKPAAQASGDQEERRWEVGFRGNYEQSAAFMQALNRLRRFSSVARLSLREDDGALAGEIVLRTFVYVPPGGNHPSTEK